MQIAPYQATIPDMLILGIETSCDETGVALFDTQAGLLGHILHSQVAIHAEYGGVVPELASRDHIRRVLPLAGQLLQRTGRTLSQLDAVAFTEGPGLAGALLVGAAVGSALAYALGITTLGIHHLEGHLLSPLLARPSPGFPFVALLVSGGHTQLMQVEGVGDYRLLGETQDDAAGEAFDKTAKSLGLPYPGGPALAALAQSGNASRYRLPRPMINSGDLDLSFSGLKTAVLLLIRETEAGQQTRADIAASFQEAVCDVLTAKCAAALHATGLDRLVVAGGVGANRRLRERLAAMTASRGAALYFPPLELCTDNGAMIAFAGALRLQVQRASGRGPSPFQVKPRWDLATLPPVNA